MQSIADAGSDQPVISRHNRDDVKQVVLDATGSSDPDGDQLTVEWSAPGGRDEHADTIAELAQRLDKNEAFSAACKRG